MADDLDWDDDDYEVADFSTVGQQKIAREKEQKFEGEDEEEEKPVAKKKPQKSPEQTKETTKYADKGATTPIEEPLDDPVAEKLRQAKRQEEADFRQTVAMFGGGSERNLDTFIPVSASDFEEYAHLVVLKHLTPHRLSNHYKAMLKHILKKMAASLSSGEIRDLETCLAGARSEKLKLEKAEKAGKENSKKGKKVSVRVENSDLSAGLDNDVYDDDDEDYDFM